MKLVLFLATVRGVFVWCVEQIITQNCVCFQKLVFKPVLYSPGGGGGVCITLIAKRDRKKHRPPGGGGGRAVPYQRNVKCREFAA